MERHFNRLALALSAYTGRIHGLVAVLLGTAAWVAWGLHFGFSDALMSWMGAVSGIVSLVLLTLLQAAQTQGNAAVNAKLDELLRAVPDARNEMMAAEALSAEEIAERAAETALLAARR